jgi:exo-beta-1,3-glucanase (GH17 family)
VGHRLLSREGASPSGQEWPPHYYVLERPQRIATRRTTPRGVVVGGLPELTKPIASSPRSTTAATWSKRFCATSTHDFAYKPVHASRGKLTRAEPIAALYEQHRVHHVGVFGTLEDQMCDYVPMASKSPDRMDALVWAITELSGDREQEVIYEYDELHSISPELDAFPDFRRF